MPTGSALEYAKQQEMKAILDCLAKKHPLGLTQRDLCNALKKSLGYKISVPTVRNRCEELRKKNKVHISIQKAKGGAILWIMGPEPPEYGQEDKGKTEEPPLAGDELLSFMHHIEGQLSGKMLTLEKKIISLEGLARRNADALTRVTVMLNCALKELGVEDKEVLPLPTERK